MTHDREMISQVLPPGVALYSVEPHIYSVYPDSKPIHDYDAIEITADRAETASGTQPSTRCGLGLAKK